MGMGGRRALEQRSHFHLRALALRLRAAFTHIFPRCISHDGHALGRPFPYVTLADDLARNRPGYHPPAHANTPSSPHAHTSSHVTPYPPSTIPLNLGLNGVFSTAARACSIVLGHLRSKNNLRFSARLSRFLNTLVCYTGGPPATPTPFPAIGAGVPKAPSEGLNEALAYTSRASEGGWRCRALVSKDWRGAEASVFKPGGR